MSKFELSGKPKQPKFDQSLMLVLFKDKLLWNENNSSIFFEKSSLPLSASQINQEFIYVGKLQKNEIYVISLSSVEDSALFKEIDSLIDDLKDDEKSILFRALQLAQWNRTAQYCGCCGGKTDLSEEEFMRTCMDCNHKIYPQYSPAVLVLVSKGNQLLLGRSYHFKPGMYSVLAGFIEAGETAEAAVRREIREEAGIEIHNIHHHSTQPWPFPNSLMIAYTAEHKSGDLHFDKKELEDVRWFSIQQLPNLPMRSSIAYHLINEFVKKAIG